MGKVVAGTSTAAAIILRIVLAHAGCCCFKKGTDAQSCEPVDGPQACASGGVYNEGACPGDNTICSPDNPGDTGGGQKAGVSVALMGLIALAAVVRMKRRRNAK